MDAELVEKQFDVVVLPQTLKVENGQKVKLARTPKIW